MTNLEKLNQAQKRILDYMEPHAIYSSADVLEHVDGQKPIIDIDTVRFAYWNLVSEGSLVRTPEGVFKCLE